MWWDVDTIITKEKLSNTPILIAHAFCGCDTTSAIYNKGEVKMVLYLKSEDFRKAASVFEKKDSTPEEIREAAIKLVIKLYNGKSSDTLALLRYCRFTQMVTEKFKFVPEILPPTASALYYHALRVFTSNNMDST